MQRTYIHRTHQNTLGPLTGEHRKQEYPFKLQPFPAATSHILCILSPGFAPHLRLSLELRTHVSYTCWGEPF